MMPTRCLVVGVLLVILAAAPANAKTKPPKVKLKVGKGEIGLIAPPDVLDGLSAAPSGSVAVALGGFGVGDRSGLGGGWIVNLAATPATSNAHVLPAGSLTIADIAAPTAQAQSTPAAQLALTPGGTLDDGIGVNVAVADPGEGMGEYVFGESTLRLAVPRSAYSGAYISNLTVTLTQTVR